MKNEFMVTTKCREIMFVSSQEQNELTAGDVSGKKNNTYVFGEVRSDRMSPNGSK